MDCECEGFYCPLWRVFPLVRAGNAGVVRACLLPRKRLRCGFWPAALCLSPRFFNASRPDTRLCAEGARPVCALIRTLVLKGYLSKKMFPRQYIRSSIHEFQHSPLGA